MYSILVPVDGSASGLDAVRHALRAAARRSDALLLAAE